MLNEEIVNKFIEERLSIYDFSIKYKIESNNLIQILRDFGFLYADAGRMTRLIIDLKFASDLYKKDETLLISEICKKFNLGQETFSKYMKNFLGWTLEKRAKCKFNDRVFDSIDTEEKAYWLGFLYADGAINSSPLDLNKKKNYNVELSLKLSDTAHVVKFAKFLNIDRVIEDSYRCRLSCNSRHLWETLNNYGCTPRKSLTLQFPNENIFKSPDLIRHFIRGYFDGDGCLSWSNKEHTVPSIQILGTYSFIKKLLIYLPESLQNLAIHHNHNNVLEETRFISTSRNKAYSFLNFIYKNSSIYLERKFERYIALPKSNFRNAESKNGEPCDGNTVLT